MYKIPMNLCCTALYSGVTDSRLPTGSFRDSDVLPGHETDALILLKRPANTILYGVGPTFLITGEYRTLYWVCKHVSRYRITEYNNNNDDDNDNNNKTNSSRRRVIKYLKTNLLIAPIALLINFPTIIAIKAYLSFSMHACIVVRDRRKVIKKR